MCWISSESVEKVNPQPLNLQVFSRNTAICNLSDSSISGIHRIHLREIPWQVVVFTDKIHYIEKNSNEFDNHWSKTNIRAPQQYFKNNFRKLGVWVIDADRVPSRRLKEPWPAHAHLRPSCPLAGESLDSCEWIAWIFRHLITFSSSDFCHWVLLFCKLTDIFRVYCIGQLRPFFFLFFNWQRLACFSLCRKSLKFGPVYRNHVFLLKIPHPCCQKPGKLFGCILFIHFPWLFGVITLKQTNFLPESLTTVWHCELSCSNLPYYRSPKVLYATSCAQYNSNSSVTCLRNWIRLMVKAHLCLRTDFCVDIACSFTWTQYLTFKSV